MLNQQTEKRHRVAISIWGTCLVDNPQYSNWILLDHLRDLDIEVVRLGDHSAEAYVALDFSMRAFKAVTSSSRSKPRLLVAFEPESVNPAQYRKSIRSLFDQTLVLSPLQRLDGKDKVIIQGPFVDTDTISRNALKSNNDRELGSIAILNENKFSFVPGNHYKTRVRAIKQLTERGHQVHLGGKSWDRGFGWQTLQQLRVLAFAIKSLSAINLREWHNPIRRNTANLHFHGRVEDGLDFLSKHEFSLAIENDSNYLSEKLLNAVAARTVPLYVGPDLALFDLPSDLAIRVDPGHHNFAAVIEGISEETKVRVLEAGLRFISNKTLLERWSHEKSLKTLAHEIHIFLDESSRS